MKKNIHQNSISLLKCTPFYVLLFLNLLVIFFVLMDLTNISSPHMPWGWEGGGWVYESKFNYTVSCVFDFFDFSVFTFIGYWVYTKSVWWATVILSVPIFIGLTQYFFFA